MIPGRMLHRVAGLLCSADFRERAIDALIADCQHEWVSAHSRARRLMTVARCWTSFWVALVGCLAHDVRHDSAGFARRIAPVVWSGFWVGLFLFKVSQDFTMRSAYAPAFAIALYRNYRSEHRSWAGAAWVVALTAAFLGARELFPEFHSILGWAAGSCVAASWTFLIKKQPSYAIETFWPASSQRQFDADGSIRTPPSHRTGGCRESQSVTP